MNPTTKNSKNLLTKLLNSNKKDNPDNIKIIDEKEQLEDNDNLVDDDSSERKPIFKNLNNKNKSNEEYVYKIHNLDMNINTSYRGKVYLCVYTVIKSSIQPFLLYLLAKDAKDNMILPYIQAKSANYVQDIESKLSTITADAKYEHSGNLMFNNELYMFYKIEDTLYSVALINKHDAWWFSLLTEICYMKKVLTFEVSNQVVELFMNHPYLCKLHDKHDNVYMSPHPLYYGSNMEFIEHVIALGVRKNSYSADFGPFFNFGSYDIATRYGGWTLKYKPQIANKLSKNLDFENIMITDNEFGRFKSSGLVRFAVFIGKHKTFLNRLHDKEDNSRYADGANIVKEKRRIVDVQGLWANEYDSVHKGELGIHQYNVQGQKGYTFVIKKFNQQSPLSYHKLDKSLMGPMYEPNKTYYIE